MSDYEIDPNLISGAMDQGVREYEPTLPVLDEWAKNTVLHDIYEWGVVTNEETGKKELIPIRIKYKDIHTISGFALSHLNMNMNYTFEESRAALLSWRNGSFTPLYHKYKKNPEALAIIDAMDKVITRNIMGGSSGGSHQGFQEALVGSSRSIRVGRSDT